MACHLQRHHLQVPLARHNLHNATAHSSHTAAASSPVPARRGGMLSHQHQGHKRASALRAAWLGAAVPLFVPSICFTDECQAAADRAFIIAVGTPILAAACIIAYLVLRRPPVDTDNRIFEDSATGVVFESPDGVAPLRDRNGDLAFRPISYTPWPVAADVEGERIRVPVGPVSNRSPRTFVFKKLLRQPSKIVTVTLPSRPLGVVFEAQELPQRRVVVVGFVPGSVAEQRRRVSGLSAAVAADASAGAASMDGASAEVPAVLEGDVLRAVTATNFVYPTRALFGAVPPERHVVLYGADKQKWSAVRAALRKGDADKDGEVTLVLERPAAAVPAVPVTANAEGDSDEEQAAAGVQSASVFDELFDV